MTTQHTTRAATASWQATPTSYAGFGAALKDWLLRADRSQKELARAMGVDPSTVSTWTRGQKRPDALSLVRLMASFRGWLGEKWNPIELLDAIACLGYDWSKIQEAAVGGFRPECIRPPFKPGGKPPGQH